MSLGRILKNFFCRHDWIFDQRLFSPINIVVTRHVCARCPAKRIVATKTEALAVKNEAYTLRTPWETLPQPPRVETRQIRDLWP